MNVRSNHQLNHQLNYYSRSSPRRRKLQPTRPLLVPPPSHQTPTSIKKTLGPISSHPSSNEATSKQDRNDVQILIEDEVDDFIHEMSSGKDSQHSSRQNSPVNEMSSSQSETKRQKIPSTTLSEQVSKDQEYKEDEMMMPSFHVGYRNKNQQIRIQDDEQNYQSEHQQAQHVSHHPITNSSPHPQQYTMNRHFTFGHVLIETQNQNNPTTVEPNAQSQTPAIPEVQLPKKLSPIISLLSQLPEPQEKKEDANMGKSKKKRLFIDLILIEDGQQQNSQAMEQYVSPKFTDILQTKEVEDHWITKDNYQEQIEVINEESSNHQTSNKSPSPQKSTHIHLSSFSLQKHQVHQQLQSEQAHQSSQPEQSHQQHQRPAYTGSNLSSRPFGEAILSINQIMHQIPQKYVPFYQQMNKKLVADQIQVEQELRRQEHEIEVLNLLIWLRKQGIDGEQYLLQSSFEGNEQGKLFGALKQKDDGQKQIQMNKVMIRSFIRKIKEKRKYLE